MTIGVVRQIIALKDSDKDVEKTRKGMQTSSGDRNKKRDTSHDREAPTLVSIATAAGIQEVPHLDELHLDLSKRHVFVVKETSPEQNSKQLGLQV